MRSKTDDPNIRLVYTNDAIAGGITLTFIISTILWLLGIAPNPPPDALIWSQGAVLVWAFGPATLKESIEARQKATNNDE